MNKLFHCSEWTSKFLWRIFILFYCNWFHSNVTGIFWNIKFRFWRKQIQVTKEYYRMLRSCEGKSQTVEITCSSHFHYMNKRLPEPEDWSSVLRKFKRMEKVGGKYSIKILLKSNRQINNFLPNKNLLVFCFFSGIWVLGWSGERHWQKNPTCPNIHCMFFVCKTLFRYWMLSTALRDLGFAMFMKKSNIPGFLLNIPLIAQQAAWWKEPSGSVRSCREGRCLEHQCHCGPEPSV